MAKPRPYAALPLGWAAIIAVLTLTPGHKMPRTPVWELLSFDTAAHAGVFAVLAALSWHSLRWQARWPALAQRAGTTAFVGCLLFGGLIELLQHTMHLGRHGDWTDLLSDGIGAVLGVAGMLILTSLQKRRARAPLTVLLAMALGAGLCPNNARAQNVPRARKTIERLASPEFRGRGYVGDGDKKAAAYLRGRLKELKLEPLAPDYTQAFTLDVNTFPGKVALGLNHHYFPRLGPVKRLRPGIDFIASATSGSGFLPKSRRLLYLDSAILNDPIRVRAFLLESREPCTVAVLDRKAQRRDELPAAIASRLDSVAALIRVVPKLTASLAASQAQQIQLEVLPQALLNTSRADNSLHAYGAEVRVEAQLKRRYPSQNLAALVRGSAQPDSFLVVSAHYDHLGTMGKAYFPGANDNASGVALLLELAAYYAQPENRPACSIAFLLFGAEEAGLVGSRHFVAHPLLPLKSIRFLVNLDLLGTGEQGATVVNGKVHEAAFRRLTGINEARHYLPALGARGRAANSDHFPFSELGVPAFFLYTRGGSAAYHDVHDQPGALSLAGFAGAFGLVRDFLNTMGASPGQR